ncbi:MAG: GIY-YIG nuclease family protein [Planctomycetota bacterium]|nr:GIY-YIG nuclease family protein [Planctomycetota bacterium]
MEKQYCIYITTNKRNTVLYTGVTNDLKRRVYEHKEKIVDGFTKKYNVNRLSKKSTKRYFLDRLKNAVMNPLIYKGYKARFSVSVQKVLKNGIFPTYWTAC